MKYDKSKENEKNKLPVRFLEILILKECIEIGFPYSIQKGTVWGRPGDCLEYLTALLFPPPMTVAG